jgi:cytochrome c
MKTLLLAAAAVRNYGRRRRGQWARLRNPRVRRRDHRQMPIRLMKFVSAFRSFGVNGAALGSFAVNGAALGYALLALPVDVSTAEAAGDAKAGQAVFNHCAACHSTSPGVNKIGPSLAGIVGSQSGAVPDFHFSSGMKNAKVTWDAGSLDKFLQNPNGFVHGTSMFFSLPNPSDRQNVIAYLQTLKH